ncbi:MAG: class I SAM-dependent methyltransferase [Gammaproteobacteria bacterium]
MRDYEDLFESRGSAYDEAMRRFPTAREQEFRQVIDRAGLKPGMNVADVPAGGGYLKSYLPADCVWRGHEPCASFYSAGAGTEEAAISVPLLPLPWADATIDAALSIAGVHHLKDKRCLFAELFRVTKPGGLFVLSDVAEGSAVARFLDGYVGANNSTGHEGIFLSNYTLIELQDAGWRVLSDEYLEFHWIFQNRESMGAFCHGLFDIRRTSVDDTIGAIETELGIDCLDDRRKGMRWGLTTIVSRRE